MATHRLRRLTEGTQEGSAHPFGVAKTGIHSNSLDRIGTALHAFSGGLHPQTFDGLGWSHAGFSHEGSGEMARAHCRLICKSLHGKPFIQALASPRQQGRKPAAWAVGFE